MDDDAYWRRPEADSGTPTQTGSGTPGDPSPAARGAPAPDYAGPPPTARPAHPRVPVYHAPRSVPLPPQDHPALDAAEARARRRTWTVAALGVLVGLLLVASAWLG